MHLRALVEFLTGLEQNNNRPWFIWNKPAYDVLRDEFEALVTDVKGLEPGYYFHVDRQGVLLAGGGIYNPDPAILGRFRRYIAKKPGALTRVLREPRFRKTYGGLAEEDTLARPPKDLAGTIAGYFRDLVPLMEWLRKAIKEPG
jgi:uncharacterized protein (DUF2461 family)